MNSLAEAERLLDEGRRVAARDDLASAETWFERAVLTYPIPAALNNRGTGNEVARRTYVPLLPALVERPDPPVVAEIAGGLEDDGRSDSRAL